MYVVTDLTQFNKEKKVCLAAVHTETGECIRPMPYLTQDYCRENRVFPGSIIAGDFERFHTTPPHIEDVHYKNLRHGGPCSSKIFKSVLDLTVCRNLISGFGGPIEDKINPETQPAKCSLITYKAGRVIIEADGFKPGKLRIHFDDHRYISLKDLGYVLNYGDRTNPETLNDYNKFLREQQDIYLRIGLTRIYKNDGRNGYWLQMNGVYTFPKYNLEVRRYV